MSNISGILYPPTLDYNYLVQRPQQLMKNFSELNIPVYYINNPSPHSRGKVGIEQVNPNFYLFHEVDPRPYLRDVRPVVYYTAAAQVDLIQQYNPSLVVFDSVDEPSEEFEAWKPYYDRAVLSADLVLTTSDRLFSMASGINPHTFLIPNGCDFEYFSQAASGNLPVPGDIAHLEGPIIGYIGVIASWLDLQLIERLALEFPEFNLVMVGPLYNISDVPRHPNIHWVGFKPYEQLACYSQFFDVGIIPFKSTSMIQAVNPIKMWEYMASGIPVVSTAIPEAEKYSGLVLHSQNHEEFLQNIRRAIFEDSFENRNARMVLAQQNSWASRAQQIILLVEQRLAEKGVAHAQPLAPITDAVPFPQLEGAPAVAATEPGIPLLDTFHAQPEFFTPFRQLKVGRRVAFKFFVTPWGRFLLPDKPGWTGQVPGSPHLRLRVARKLSFKLRTVRAQSICGC